jgi:hypothetical protein
VLKIWPPKQMRILWFTTRDTRKLPRPKTFLLFEYIVKLNRTYDIQRLY